MKKLTRARVVPIISARVSWLILAMTGSGLPSLPKFASSSSSRASRFSLELNKLVDEVFFDADGARQQVRDEHLGKCRLVMDHADDGRFLQPHDVHSIIAVTVAMRRGCRGETSLAEEIIRVQELRRPPLCLASETTVILTLPFWM